MEDDKCAILCYLLHINGGDGNMWTLVAGHRVDLERPVINGSSGLRPVLIT
jgi:hypothetical protein